MGRAPFVPALTAHKVASSLFLVLEHLYWPLFLGVPFLARVTGNLLLALQAQQSCMASCTMLFIIHIKSVEPCMPQMLIATFAVVEIYIFCGTALVCAFSTHQLFRFACAVLFQNINGPVSSWVFFATGAIADVTIHMQFSAGPLL